MTWGLCRPAVAHQDIDDAVVVLDARVNAGHPAVLGYPVLPSAPSAVGTANAEPIGVGERAWRAGPVVEEERQVHDARVGPPTPALQQ